MTANRPNTARCTRDLGIQSGSLSRPARQTSSAAAPISATKLAWRLTPASSREKRVAGISATKARKQSSTGNRLYDAAMRSPAASRIPETARVLIISDRGPKAMMEARTSAATRMAPRQTSGRSASQSIIPDPAIMLNHSPRPLRGGSDCVALYSPTCRSRLVRRRVAG